MNDKKRAVELVVISDIHLGTIGSHAKELFKYLKSIKPKTLILNGDIIDIWQFKKRYWPKSHMKVVKHILGLAAKGTRIVYLVGNHDETLRRFDNTNIGNLEIYNKLEMTLDGKKTIFFHGDVFDVIIKHSKWLAKLGAVSYDTLILINLFINWIARSLGKEKISFSKKIKDNVKTAVKFIGDFEKGAAELAMQKKFDQVVCGHIHNPCIRKIKNENGNSVTYLNSGDWIENLSALEYHNKEWKIYHYYEDRKLCDKPNDQNEWAENLNNKQLFNLMLEEFKN